MGQKVNPNGLRIGVNKDWESKWIAGKKTFGSYLIEDEQIRKYIKEVYKPVPLSSGKEGEVSEETSSVEGQENQETQE